MKYIRFLILAGLVLLMSWVLSNPIKTSSNAIPALGYLLNPFTGFLESAVSNNMAAKEEILLIDGVEESVTIVFDDRMVPHIYAKSMKDAFYAQGYVHAMHRNFQMDIVSRASSGRLSEIFGEVTYEYDRMMLRRGMGFAAENALSGWQKKKKTMTLLDSYCAGANNFMNTLITSGKKPIEYKILDFEPSLWSPLKVANVYKSMAYDLSFRNEDIAATKTIKTLGDSLFNFIYPYVDEDDMDPILSMPLDFGDSLLLPKQYHSVPNGDIGNALESSQPDRNIGSNNWAIHGSRTFSGSPLLANDPHLGLSLPSVWYEVHIITPEMNVRGVSLPGIPSVILGFNENIAWGATNGSQDVLNWFEIEWTDRTTGKYLLDGVEVEAYPRIERIPVKGKKDRMDTVLYTVFGPVLQVSDSIELAMQWMAHKNFEMDELGAFQEINMASNFDEFREALTEYSGPIQNFVFASIDGDIGIIVNGKIPIKEERESRFIQKGQNIRQARPAFIPYDQLPMELNPERGFVSSANQISTDSSYPYELFGYYENFRNRYLNRKLRQLNEATVEDMKRLQLDNYNLEAEEFINTALQTFRAKEVPEELGPWIEKFSTWDFIFDENNELSTLYEIWSRQFYLGLWDELKLQDGKDRMLLPESWRMVDLMEDDPVHPIFDNLETKTKESASDLLLTTLIESVKKFESLDPEQRKWGPYKGSEIRHISRIPGFGEEIINGGHASALNAMTSAHGPSWRFVVSLEKPLRAYGIYPGGQSGNPGSPYYDSSVEKWKNGEYYELDLPSNPDQVKNPKCTITLKKDIN